MMKQERKPNSEVFRIDSHIRRSIAAPTCRSLPRTVSRSSEDFQELTVDERRSVAVLLAIETESIQNIRVIGDSATPTYVHPNT